MATLYEIDAAIMDCVDTETGEIIDEEKLNSLLMERSAKLEGVALWIKNLDSDATAIRAEREALEKRQKAAENKVSSQVLLSPVTVTLSKTDYDTVLSNLDVFSKAGYLVEDFGSGVVIVRECPMLISGDDIEDTVVEIASYLVLNKTNVESEKIDYIHHTSACKAAIKAGYKNSTAEMKVLAEQVLYDDEIRYCPHGRPVMIEMSKYDLEKQFGRIQ